MMITIETLRVFCQENEPPEWINTPWSQEGYTYATDGHVIVRVPQLAGVEEKTIQQIWALPWRELEKPVKWMLRPETLRAVREHYLCLKCDPRAPRAVLCPECNGISTNEDCVCFGNGMSKTDTHQPWNTADCPSCEGSGWRWYEVCWQLGEERKGGGVSVLYVINVMLLQRLVDHLGMIGFMEPPTGSNPQGPVGFRFDGGAGLLMPMHYLHGTVIANKEKEAQDE